MGVKTGGEKKSLKKKVNPVGIDSKTKKHRILKRIQKKEGKTKPKCSGRKGKSGVLFVYCLSVSLSFLWVAEEEYILIMNALHPLLNVVQVFGSTVNHDSFPQGREKKCKRKKKRKKEICLL